VIDVRGDDEFMGDLGHISSARNIPVQELATRIGELAAAKGDPITMVCKTDMRSAKAADILRGQGFTHVSALKGGMEAWTQHGFSVDR
jgi:rhodanese-related sulfurtransferase